MLELGNNKNGPLTYKAFFVGLGYRHISIDLNGLEETALEKLARCIIRASFSQERMSHVEVDGIVACRSKNGAAQEVFDALEWLAAMCSHVPDKG